MSEIRPQHSQAKAFTLTAWDAIRRMRGMSPLVSDDMPEGQAYRYVTISKRIEEDLKNLLDVLDEEEIEVGV